MKKLAALAGALILIGTGFMAGPALSGGHEKWVLSGTESNLAYGSIKKNEVGEVNHFTKLSGEVSEQGDVAITIDLASVETNIDIRNERMLKHVFDALNPQATLKAKVDMAALKKLAPGETAMMELEAVLSFAGVDVAVDSDMFVARLSDRKVLVSTNDMVMLDAEDLGINSGIDKLAEIANLDSITRVSPVSARLVFDLQGH